MSFAFRDLSRFGDRRFSLSRFGLCRVRFHAWRARNALRSECLGDGLLPSTPPSSTATTATASADAALRSSRNGSGFRLLPLDRPGLCGDRLRFDFFLGAFHSFAATLGLSFRRLFGIKIRRLQWRRRRLTHLLIGFLLAAL